MKPSEIQWSWYDWRQYNDDDMNGNYVDDSE